MSEQLKEDLKTEVSCEENSEECSESQVNGEANDKKEVDLQAEVNRLNDQLLRNQAELQNFKKRMNDERIKANKYRSQNLAEAILPALDTFEHAISVTTEDETIKNFLVGFEMIHKQFIESLATEGVEIIEAVGKPFDPNFHQAVMQEEVAGTKPGIVLAEMQKGYKLKDRVIRPSMVKVSQ